MSDMLSGVGDTILNGLQAILYSTVYKLLYYMAVGCCWIIDLLYSMFEVMAGLSKVSYDGDFDYLINIFFSNTTVSKIYWGMALIGLTVGFAFAIAAVIKKLFDTSDKEKRSYGQILTGLFKSALTILCMSLIITMVLNATTLLMQQINYVFINADNLGEEKSITYTDEEYAAMARALNTIGNFSLNPSYNNRFNLNKCFNEVRLDLQYLKQQGVFEFHYVTTDVEGNTIATWQSALQKIANSASLDRDLSLDVYHESVSNSILNAMDLLKVNGSFKPLEEYQRHYQPSRTSLSMDRFLFLMATMRAAKNTDYNVDPSLTDPLRGAYYYGEKSIYDLDTVNEDFDIGIAAFDYLILFLTCFKMLVTLVTIILNCVGRIFNMLLLYLISPLILAVSPLDDGAKFKQWTTAFIVQSFSVFGTVISMRVLLLFMPIVIDPKLVLFPNPVANLLAKLVIVLGGFEVSEKATNLITGILADNAGWQSITAGDMSGTAKGVVEKGKQMASHYGGKALKTVGGAGLSALGFGAKMGLKGAAGVGLGLGYGAYYGGKAAGKAVGYGAKAVYSGGKALASKISAWRNSGGKDNSSNSKIDKMAEYAPQTTTGFEGFGSTPVGQQSPKIAAMAAAFDAHNAGQKSATVQQSSKIAAMANAFNEHNMNPGQQTADPYAAGQAVTRGGGPQTQQSSKIAAMANAFNEHNMNPGQQTTDPYAAGQAAQTQKSVKQPPKSLRKQQNKS